MTPLQRKMFSELKSKELFHAAQQYVFDYIDTAAERNVYPTRQAINNMKIFQEPMPLKPSGALETLEMLNRYAAPATVAQIYGRYFGFVNGSSLPVTLAAKYLST